MASTTTARLRAVRQKIVNKNIIRALFSLASANLLIRLMGMANQVVVTARFGQSATMDAYYVASTIPFLLAQLLASAIEASVIPVYMKIRTEGSKEQASRLFSTLLNLLLISLVAFTLFMLCFRQQFVIISAPGLPSHSHQLATDLTPFIFPVLVFMTLSSFLECLLNTEGQFGLPAYAGILIPLTTVTFVLLGGKTYGVLMLCIGTLVGQFLQIIVLVIRARQAKFSYRFVLDLRSKEIATIGIVAWPALFTALISQASLLVDQIFASGLAAGSIAAITNALKLISVPIGVVFSSAGRALLPYLSDQAATKDMQGFKATLRFYLWAVGIGTLIMSAFMIFGAHFIVRTLFQHGAFTAQDTDHTAITLIGFSIGLVPMAFGFITSRAFSALGQTRLLLYVTIFSVAANAIFDYIFAYWWQSFGIALATSAVYACTMMILLFALRRMIGKLDLLTLPHEFVEVLWKLRLGSAYLHCVNWKEKHLQTLRIPYLSTQRLIRVSTIIFVFLAGTVGTIYNSLYTLRIAFGSLVILAFLRYHYLFLLAWVALDVLIGSTLPFFNGNNLLSGLTIPMVLLMFVIPIKPAFKSMPTLAFLFAYFLWMLASIGNTAIPIAQFFTLWLVYMATVAIGVLAINQLTTRRRLMGIIDAILLQALFVALYGIYGYFTLQNGHYDTNIAGLYRTGSLFDAPPTLAFFLSMTIPLAIYRTVTLQGTMRLLSLTNLLVMLAAMALTFTRVANFSLPLSILLMICFLPSRKLKMSLLAGTVALAAIVMLVILTLNLPLLERFLNPDILTFNGRTYLWSALLEHFDPAQLLGNGLGSSEVLLTNLQVGVGRGVIGTAPHNIFLSALYDHGLVGVTLLSLMLIALPWNLLSRLRKATPDHRLIIAMALAVYINILIQSMFVTVIWTQQIGAYVWMILSLPFVSYWSMYQTPTEVEDTVELSIYQNDQYNKEQAIHA